MQTPNVIKKSEKHADHRETCLPRAYKKSANVNMNTHETNARRCLELVEMVRTHARTFTQLTMCIVEFISLMQCWAIPALPAPRDIK